MKKLRLFILAISFIFPLVASAETIVLKSGKTVEGKLIEKTGEYIKMDFQGVPLTYFLDEIESIDGNPVISAPVKVTPDQAAPEYKKAVEISSGVSEGEKTIEMILEKAKNARANMKTVRIKGTDILGNEVRNFEMEIDLDNKVMAMTVEKNGQVLSRAYIKQGITYMQVLGKWMKLEGEMNLFGNMLDRERWSNIVPQNYKETGFSYTLKGEEVVEGRPCYVLFSTIVDKEKVKEYLRASPDKFIPADVVAQIKNTPEFENMLELSTQKMESTQWIDKDTFFNIRTLTKTLDKNREGQVVLREKEETHYDINKPFNIVVPEEALQANALKEEARTAEEFLKEGLEYFKQSKFDQAISDFNKAIEINPNLGAAYNNRAIVYFFKKEYDKAWEDVHKAESLGIKPNPDFLDHLRKASGREN